MANKIIIDPEVLLSQSSAMTKLKNDYEDLFSNITKTLNDTNGNWSDNLAHNFAGKINSAQKSFSMVVSELEKGAIAAKNSADTMQNIDTELSRQIGNDENKKDVSRSSKDSSNKKVTKDSSNKKVTKDSSNKKGTKNKSDKKKTKKRVNNSEAEKMWQDAYDALPESHKEFVDKYDVSWEKLEKIIDQYDDPAKRIVLKFFLKAGLLPSNESLRAGEEFDKSIAQLSEVINKKQVDKIPECVMNIVGSYINQQKEYIVTAGNYAIEDAEKYFSEYEKKYNKINDLMTGKKEFELSDLKDIYSFAKGLFGFKAETVIK